MRQEKTEGVGPGRYKGTGGTGTVNPYGFGTARAGSYRGRADVPSIGSGLPTPLAPSDVVKPGWIKNVGHKTVNVEGVVIKPGEVAELPTTRTLDAALKHQDIEQATPEELQAQEAVRKNKGKTIEKPAPMLEEPKPVV